MAQTNSEKVEIANVELCKNLSDRMSQLCMSHNYCDVFFIVEGEKLPAHKCILAAGNKFFENLLYGDLSESKQKEIEMKVPLEAFKVLLRFIYSGRICLKVIEEDVVLDTLILANTYDYMDLEVAIVEYLKEILGSRNCLDIFKIAWLCELLHLKEACYNLLDRNASELLVNESFNHLSEKMLQDVLGRDSFIVPEFEIFTAVRDWYKHNPSGDVDSVLSCVRFPLMTDNELVKARKSEIVSLQKLMDAIEVRCQSSKLPYRVLPGENMIALKFGSKIIQGSWENQPSPPGDIFPSDPRTPVQVSANGFEGIVVELGITSIINHIRVALFQQTTYFLELSTNKSQWERVVDYRNCCCQNLQSLFFPPRYVKYIKLVGTRDLGLTITALKATYADIIPKQINGFTAASIELFQAGQPKKALFQTSLYNSLKVKVRLDQPYYVGLIRVYLSCYTDHRYDYKIEVSTNDEDWWSVANKYADTTTSWLNISFPPRPVVYIKISSDTCLCRLVEKIINFEQYDEIAPDGND